MNRFNLTLDLDKRGGVAQWVTMRQGDHNGTELRATIYDHGTQAGGGYTCRVVIRRPDVAEYYRETCEYSSGVATVTIDEQYAAAISGSTYGYFELLQGGSVIASTESFGVRILPDATADATVGPEYDSAIEDALAELDEATGRISQMVVDATEEYLEAHPELTTTVEDNSLTDAKLIQSGGILDRVARLWHRLDNLLTSTPAESDALTVSDAAKTPLAGLALYGRSTQDGTPTPSAPVAIESVTPNLLDVSTLLAHGIGTTYTIGADGRVTVNASDGKSWASQATIDLPVGTYTLMREVNRGRIQLALYDVGSTSARQTIALEANGALSQTFTVTVPTQARLKVGNSSDASNYPFTTGVALYAGNAWCPFVPYNSMGLWARGRNLWQTVKTQTISGVAVTANSDGSVTLNGTATATVNIDTLFVVPRTGTYRISGCPSGGGSSTYQLWTYDTVTPRDPQITDVGSGATGTFTEGHIIALRIRVQSGYTCNNVVMRPMLALGSAEQEFMPYAESVTPIPLQGHALRSLPDGTRDEVTVDQYGHASLTQRVAYVALSSSFDWKMSSNTDNNLRKFYADSVVEYVYTNNANSMSNRFTCPQNSPTFADMHEYEFGIQNWGDGRLMLCVNTDITTIEQLKAWLDSNPSEIMLRKKTPQTIDLGTIDPIALQGPDMTAQAVPTAPFALTYERDLNVTLARLETAIADAATS